MRFLPLLLLTCAISAQELPRAARILRFEARPAVAKKGEPVELQWATTGADRVWLEPPGEELPPQGRTSRVPDGKTIYWLSVGNLRGGQTVPAVVEVVPAGRPELTPSSGFWIQFAALADADRARRLQEEIGRSLGDPVRLFQVADPNRSGLSLQRIRTGPFPTRQTAQRRLREIRPRARALHLNPMVMAD